MQWGARAPRRSHTRRPCVTVVTRGGNSFVTCGGGNRSTLFRHSPPLMPLHFGHLGFRPAQREVVSALLAGRDVLGILPNGAGKSICYQLPALLLPRLTVVVSPLIALMKDQLEGLPSDLRHRATLINSQ